MASLGILGDNVYAAYTAMWHFVLTQYDFLIKEVAIITFCEGYLILSKWNSSFYTNEDLKMLP